MSIFVKIRQVDAELFHAGGRRDGHAEANIRLENLRLCLTICFFL